MLAWLGSLTGPALVVCYGGFKLSMQSISNFFDNLDDVSAWCVFSPQPLAACCST